MFYVAQRQFCLHFDNICCSHFYCANSCQGSLQYTTHICMYVCVCCVVAVVVLQLCKCPCVWLQVGTYALACFRIFPLVRFYFLCFPFCCLFVVACCNFSRSLKLCFHLCNMCEQSNKMNACNIDSDIHSYKWIFIKIHVHCIQGDCKDRWDSQIHKSVYKWV